MPHASSDPLDHLPLKPQDFHILWVLARSDLHGYGIMKAVEEKTGGRVTLEIGSLYRLLNRLLEGGLVADAPAPSDETDTRRRYYGLTPLGRSVLEAEARRLEEVVEAVRRDRILGGAAGS